MKFQNTLILCTLVFFGCSSVANNSEQPKKDNHHLCQKKAMYGATEICLPIIDRMTESYSNPKVKERSDLFRYDNNTILGIYLNDKNYSQIKQFDSIELDDYYKVYATKNMENIDVNTTTFNDIGKSMSNNHMRITWKEVRDEIPIGSPNLSIGVPAIIETYKPNEKIWTSVLIVKMTDGAKDYITFLTMNLVHCKERIIFYAYYKDYADSKTLMNVKAKNDLFGYKLLEVNN